MQTLVEKGFPDIKELAGGFSAWQKAEYPAASAPTPDYPASPSLNAQLGLSARDAAIDFRLKDMAGNQVSLTELVARKPVMLQFGSYTCPQFREQVAGTELLIARYRDRVQFVVVYVIEPHPFGSKSPYSDGEWQSIYSFDRKANPVTQPLTYEERVRLASECVKDTGMTSLVLVDEFNNLVWQIYGPAPNLAYFIDTNGSIIKAQPWYKASEMETAIKGYLDNPGTK